MRQVCALGGLAWREGLFEPGGILLRLNGKEAQQLALQHGVAERLAREVHEIDSRGVLASEGQDFCPQPRGGTHRHPFLLLLKW